MSYITIGYEYRHHTDDAVLIFDGTKEVWIPKSVIEDGHSIDFESEYKIEIQEWFAIKEEII